MRRSRMSRRRFVAGTAATTAAVITAPYVHTAHAAGSLTIGMWDHWVPGANAATEKLVKEWGEKEKVDVKIDFITSQGNKLLLTIAAEAQAGSGHDIMEFTNWEAVQHEFALGSHDDVMKDVLAANGPIDPAVEYLAKYEGRWLGVPTTHGTLLLGTCSRFDLMKEHAGIDVQALYPAGKPPADASWTWDAFATAAEKCNKAGFAFGLPMGVTTDTVQWIGALFLAYGADVMDKNGEITVKTDAVKQVLEYIKRLMPSLPPDVPSWDDAGNNKWLISGKGSLIFNPPSAWAVAKRDAPQIAEKCWTHGFPKGPKARVNPMLPRYLGIWKSSKNQAAAKSLVSFMASRKVAEAQVAASQGYDIPPYPKFTEFKTWAEQGPPTGSIYHYPIQPGGDQIAGVVCSPAPPLIAAQIWAQAIQPKMCVRYAKGEKLESVLDWAANELEGFKRT
ncbi:MAG: ABC transporter substrate-binding protein [Hyphomicrobiaceae bacterium]